MPHHKAEDKAFVSHLFRGRRRDRDRLRIHHFPQLPVRRHIHKGTIQILDGRTPQ